MDPKYVQPGSAQRCEEVGHACCGLFCGCPCHDQERARINDALGLAQAPIPVEDPLEPTPRDNGPDDPSAGEV
jgi:hypothetical protein